MTARQWRAVIRQASWCAVQRAVAAMRLLPTSLVDVESAEVDRKYRIQLTDSLKPKRARAHHGLAMSGPWRWAAWVMTVLVLYLGSPPARALSQGLLLSQFNHTVWTASDGIPAPVYSLAQTDDGFLWIGTADGLFRFDGVTFERIRTLGGEPIGDQEVRFLSADAGNGLWLGYGGNGGGHLKDGRYMHLGPKQGWDIITQAATDLDGTTWLIANRRLARLVGIQKVEVGPDQAYPREATGQIAIDRRGTVWARSATVGEHGFYYLPRGQQRFQQVLLDFEPQRFAVAGDGAVWGCSEAGLRVLLMNDDVPVGVRLISPLPCRELWFDRGGSLWVLVRDGLVRIVDPNPAAEPTADSVLKNKLSHRQDLVSRDVSQFLEDKEGNVWLGTGSGLERLRQTKFTPVALPRSTNSGYSVAAADNGAVWVAARSGSLWKVAGGNLGEKRELGHPVFCLHGAPDGTLWAGSATALLRVGTSGAPIELALPARVANDRVRAINTDSSGAVWVGSGSGGNVGRLSNGQWSVPPIQGQSAERWYSRAMLSGGSGRVWFGYMNEIVLLENGQTRQITPALETIRIGPINAFYERDGRLWVAGAEGVSWFDGKKFHAILDEQGRPFRRIGGIAETADGDLWLHGLNFVTRVPASELRRAFSDFGALLQTERFDSHDGIYGAAPTSDQRPTLIEAKDGRLWFSTDEGVAWIDPHAVARIKGRAAPFVRSIVVDGATLALGASKRLPPNSRRIEIEFSAIALSQPEHVRFKYRLVGVDPNWQDAGNSRRAQYSYLPPGDHRFQLLATDQEGTWSGEPADVDFTIAAAWYQTLAFQSLCVLAAIASAWLLYRFRVTQVTRQVRTHLGIQMMERLRIARELHDTFLQSVHVLVWRFQEVAEKLPPDDPLRTSMDSAMLLADRVLVEGRDRVSGLRDDSAPARILSEEIRTAGEELATKTTAEFRMSVEGVERQLDWNTQREVCSIVQEALINAFRHSNGSKVTVTLNFKRRGLDIDVQDNGIGIKPEVLQRGRPGHWGLAGMRERALEIRASINISNLPSGGLRIQLQLRANSAFV
jgi:signal transduction histidine kinase/ligand-binding sensor domain-containing protein